MYAGTDATLLQVQTHEIGHTLGLADNADPNSIMYYAVTANNRTFDSTDIAGVQALYGSKTPSGSTATNINQLIQAMSTFGSNAGAATTAFSPQLLMHLDNHTLASPARVHQ